MTDSHDKSLYDTQPINTIPDLSIQDYITLIQYLNLPAMVFDSAHKLLGVNFTFRKIIQLSYEDIQETGLQVFFGDDTWDRLSGQREEDGLTTPGAALVLETEFDHQGKFYKLTLTPIRNIRSTIIGYLLFFIDMTREKMLEQVRADFTSMIVHDLRSPLTAIMGNLELLFMEFERVCEDDTRELFQDSLEQSQRLLNLINDLLDVSKIESGKFNLTKELVDPTELIKYAIRSMDPLAKRESIDLQFNIEQNLPHIHVDKDKIIQVLINVLSNAIKFTPENGLVNIQARLVKTHDNNEAVHISIADTGEGIKDENVSKLFSKYQQVGNKKQKKIKGTGLGLFIVKELMDAHNGQVNVVSQYSQGSCFSLLFPIEHDQFPL